MVLVKMLMEIDPLLMRGSLVMMLVMTSPSRREVSPAEQLRQSPRLIPPRFRLVAAEFRPVSLPLIFSRVKVMIYQKMDAGGPPRGPRDRRPRPTGGHAPCLVDMVWAPWPISFAHKFLLNPKSCFMEFQDFWSCAE